MNTSQFTDKQIMDLSNSQHSNNDIIDLMNPPQEDLIGNKEEIVPSYDFQPIRHPIVSSQQQQQSNLDSSGARVWNSADSRTNTTAIASRNYGSLDSIEPANAIFEKDRNVNNVELVSAIDQTMKKHADSILHALEGVSARLSQLESRTRHLENSVDDLKISSGTNHGSTDGQLRQLENIFREVQESVQVIMDKQDRVEGQLHLLQVSKIEPQPQTPQNTARPDNLHQAPPPPQQFHQQLLPAVQPPSSIPLPNAPPTASQQNLAPHIQLQHQYPPNQISSVPQREPYLPPPPGQTQEATNQQYQHPPPPQQVPPHLPALPQQPYQPSPPPPQYNQPPPPQQHPSLSAVNPPQPQLSVGHHLEELPYAPPQNYPPNLHQPPPHPPSGTQQYFGPPPNMYEPPSGKANSGFSPSYSLGPSSGTNEHYSFSGSPSQYGGGSMKQHLSSASAQGGGNIYPQLPTARVLPQALPTATGVGGGGAGTGSSGSGNRVPIDDVVDKLSTMGFTRDQVRATVRKLTENGQSVDLNVVLDKLMNEGEGQPQRGWFGR